MMGYINQYSPPKTVEIDMVDRSHGEVKYDNYIGI